MHPFITVVVPVRNEARFIADTLLQLLRQDYPRDRFEIIVADGMSNDGTREIVFNLAREYPMLRLIPNRKRFSGAGRNIGFEHGKGDIFVVVDGHCHIDHNGYFTAIVESFAKSGADCLGRPQPLDPPGLTLFQKAVALARSSPIGHGGDSLIYSDYEGYASPVSNGAAYTRKVIEHLRSVDERFDACEDVEFNYRVEQAGFTTYTSPALAVRYYPREHLKGLFSQMMRYGQGRFRLLEKHAGTFSLNTLVPALFVAGIALLAAAALLSPLSALFLGLFDLLALVFILYGLLVTGEAVRIASRSGLRHLVFLPFVFIAIHAGLGAGFLREMARAGHAVLLPAALKRGALKRTALR
ncbi:MAG: glycosyltransferase family 2 protein [Nitrospirota bacterium]